MIKRILLLVLLIFATPVALAAWNLGGGLESYQWQEYPQGSTGTPKESGPRAAFFANWTQEGIGPLFAWHAKVYGGTVNYDTFAMCNCASNGAPVSTQTEYRGVANEGQFFYRDDLGDYKLDYIGGLGLDTWRRRILNYGGDQIEDYSIFFARAGVRLGKARTEAGFHGEFGLKYPVSTNEDAHLYSAGYTTNPSLSPKGAISGYAEFGYRINTRFDVVGYYDSWRFAQSANVIANKPTDPPGSYWLIYQPKSNMDALGAKLLISF